VTYLPVRFLKTASFQSNSLFSLKYTLQLF
jgi:hypothetical protein